MSQDNGDPKETKHTPEYEAELRLQRYKEKPESFIEQSEVIVCVKRTPKGPAYMIQPCTYIELLIAQDKVNDMVSQGKKALAMAEAPLIKAPGGFKKTSGAFGKNRLFRE